MLDRNLQFGFYTLNLDLNHHVEIHAFGFEQEDSCPPNGAPISIIRCFIRHLGVKDNTLWVDVEGNREATASFGNPFQIFHKTAPISVSSLSISKFDLDRLSSSDFLRFALSSLIDLQT